MADNKQIRIVFPNNEININTEKLVQKIINEQAPEEPLFICNCDELVRLYELWVKLMPRVKPYYAIKCNDNKMVLRILGSLGCYFDCASASEIQAVLDLGICQSRIIYANPIKPPSHLKFANKLGVLEAVFDNEAELYKTKTLHPQAKLLLRLSIEDVNALHPLGCKFGAPLSEAKELLQKAKDLGLNMVGICFHLGSGCRTFEIYREGMKACLELFQYAKTELDMSMEIMDIGGGQSIDTIYQIAEVINSTLEEYKEDFSKIDVRAEPGRYFVESAFTLLTQVLSLRMNPKTKPSLMYYINAGIFSGLGNVLFDSANVQPIPVRQNIENSCAKLSNDEELYEECSIWGPTMCTIDQVCTQTKLPKLTIGDWVYFENMGAYSLVVSSTFNGFTKPEVCYIASNTVWEKLQI